MQKEPLILTVLMDAASHQYFTGLRNLHFPKHCNYLEAHITLFHKLPPGKKMIDTILKQVSKTNKIQLQINAVKNFGTGVAFEVRSPELLQLRRTLQQKFAPFLSMQDRQKYWPHITVQNKVTAFKALKTFELLQKDFKPFTVQATGIASWLYKGGPWQKTEEYLFGQ